MAGSVAAAADQPHNVVLFVPDGLRALMVDKQTAPTMASLRDQGVAFKNSHSLFPTFTTPNASAMATGHYLGDTGDFSNTIYTGYPVPGAGGSITPFLESDPVLGDVDEHFAGEVTLLKAARDAGYNTATIGKLGPALIFDHTERTGLQTIVVDDSTGSKNGIPAGALAGRCARQGRSADDGARPRRERQVGQCDDARHERREHRAAGLFRRRDDQGGAAEIQAGRQALRRRVLVARPRRDPAQSRRQPQTS